MNGGLADIDQNLAIMRDEKYRWIIIYDEPTFVLAYSSYSMAFIFFWDPDAVTP